MMWLRGSIFYHTRSRYIWFVPLPWVLRGPCCFSQKAKTLGTRESFLIVEVISRLDEDPACPNPILNSLFSQGISIASVDTGLRFGLGG